MHKTINMRILKSDKINKMPVIIHPRVVRKDKNLPRKTKPINRTGGCGCGRRVSRR